MVQQITRAGRVGFVTRIGAVTLSAFGLATCGGSAGSGTDDTASPIKHVIIVVGENRSFDHLFATYVSPHPQEGIHNLLSEQIVTASGAPGALFSKAHQYRISSAPNSGSFFISADLKDKTLYATLERNWKLSETLSERSRDNLPNPVQDPGNPYVPTNMPAIGDLFDMFQFQ